MKTLSKKHWIAFFIIATIYISFFMLISDTYTSIFAAIFGSLLCIFLIDNFLKESLEEYGFHFRNIHIQIISGIVLTFLMTFILHYNAISNFISKNGFLFSIGDLMKRLVDCFGSYASFFLDFFSTLVNAISEEILYRGFILTLFQRAFHSSSLSVFLSALLFGLSHFPFHQNWYTVIFAFIFGIVYGYLRIKEPEKFTIFSLCLAHFLQNFSLSFLLPFTNF